MGNAKIDELEIEFPEGMKISMKKNAEKEIVVTNGTQMQSNTIQSAIMPTTNTVSSTIMSNPNNTEASTNKTTGKENTQEENYKIIKSPMVGTFYSRPAPNKDAFTKVGDTVKKGQVICIVEAMKLMNEIESEFDGEVVEICVNNEDMVEYGAPLFKLK